MEHRDAPIVLFTIYGCKYCQAAIKFLKGSNVRFKAVNIGNDATKMRRLAEWTGVPTVPKIFVQGRFIGGYTDMIRMAESGELAHLLSQPMA